MTSLDEVYRKFGEVAESAQLLETELGNLVLAAGMLEADLIAKPNKELAAAIFERVNRKTLGQLLKSAHSSVKSIPELESLLVQALEERNRLSHSFYRQHNFRRNSDQGREMMVGDLEAIHAVLLNAYKALLLMSGVDLDALSAQDLPTKHVPIA